jgi:hypothetical protein
LLDIYEYGLSQTLKNVRDEGFSTCGVKRQGIDFDSSHSFAVQNPRNLVSRLRGKGG